MDIQHCIMFVDEGLQAAEYYCSLFPDSGIDAVKEGPDGPLLVNFHLGTQRYWALNGGQGHGEFNPKFSIVVTVDGQTELDQLWDRLIADGGRAMFCGWCTDKYGVCWQIVPRQLQAWMHDDDPGVQARVHAQMMTMVKLDLEPLAKAAAGEESSQ